MELIKNFASLTKTFSEDFPEFEELAPLYILAFVIIEFDTANSLFFEYSSGFGFIINPEVLREIEKYNSIDIKQIPKDEFKEVCDYLIEECFNTAKRYSNSPINLQSFLLSLAERETQAVWIEENKPETIESIRASFGEKRATIQLSNNNRFVIDFNKLSNKGFKEWAELQISKALRFEKQELFPNKVLDELLVKLAAPKSDQRIFSPSIGIGSVFVEFQKQFPNYYLEFEGEVSNSFTYLLCQANLLANGVEALVSNGNALKFPPYEETPETDIAIAVLPFRMRGGEKELEPEFFRDTHKLTKAEYAFVELMLSKLNDKGKAIVVVTENFLFSKQGKLLRKKFATNDWIESVISLPKDTFKPNASIKTSIIVFNKNKADKGFVVFDGEDDNFEETRISANLIKAQNNIDLRASRYALKETKEVESILSKYPQNEVKKIKDLIVSPSILGRNYSQNLVTIGNGSNSKVPFIRVSELSKIGEDFKLNTSKIEKRIDPQNNGRKINLIDFDAVLVNLIGNKLKPTYFKFEGKPIAIGSDVIALKMKEDINVEYFLTQLHSRLVQIQVEMFSSGTTINRISKEDFLNIQILLPSLEEQKHRVEEFRDSVFKVAKERDEAESERDEVEYQTIANMNHSLKNKLGAIVGGYDTLVRFLKRKEQENTPVKFDEPIFPVREGENVEDIDTIATITERLKKHLLDASNVFNSFEKIEQLHLNKETVELVSYFKNELKPLYKGANFTIEAMAKPKLKLYVLIDKNSFKDVIENLIENARKHGFVSEDRKYKIVFELSEQADVYDEESETYKSYARILYKNDGKAFPKGFSFDDYTEYSNKAGKTQGMGIGGSIISRQIKKHGGKLNCISIDETDSLFPIQFEILLPLDD